jgi:hypothetical protein
MLAALMDEDATSFTLKEAYRCDSSKLTMLMEAFPFAAVLKKVSTSLLASIALHSLLMHMCACG